MIYARGLTLVAAAVALTACGAIKPVSHMTYSEVQALAQQIEQRCVAQGVKPGTPEFSACTKQESVREATIRRETYDRITGADEMVCNPVGSAMVCN